MRSIATGRQADVPCESTGARGLLARLGATMRRIIGAPDYGAYVAHVAAHHPGREPLSERAFVAERLSARYEKPGSRCC